MALFTLNLCTESDRGIVWQAFRVFADSLREALERVRAYARTLGITLLPDLFILSAKVRARRFNIHPSARTAIEVL